MGNILRNKAQKKFIMVILLIIKITRIIIPETLWIIKYLTLENLASLKLEQTIMGIKRIRLSSIATQVE